MHAHDIVGDVSKLGTTLEKHFANELQLLH